MKNYNIKNLTNNKIAIDCNSWEMAKEVVAILKRDYPCDLGWKNEWLETTPFMAILPGDGITSYAQFTHLGWEKHYWVKEKGLTIIPGSDFIRDNPLAAEAVSSPGTSGDGTVQQQDYSCKCGVGGGSGNLFVYGNHDSIRMCQRKLLELECLRLTSDNSNGFTFASWLDTHRKGNSVVWNSYLSYTYSDPTMDLYSIFLEEIKAGRV